MIIVMKPDATAADIDYVISRAHSLGLRTHRSQGEGDLLINLLGDTQAAPVEVWKGLRGVDRVVKLSKPYRLVSKDFKQDESTVTVNGHEIGGNKIVVIAGPCAVESRHQILEAAAIVRDAGASMLRGGAFKPRTSPYSFQGLEEKGLELLAEAREATGLSIVTEVMTPEQLPLVSQYADILQIGTRNMQNFALLHAVGECGKPVLLKRGLMSSIQELLMSAEYILSHGNRKVILCERGIRTFETLTRNTLDISAVPLLKELTHLPVIVDPSHATGKASLVPSASRAAVAAGCDGLLVEVHPNPVAALSDGYQSLSPDTFHELMDQLRVLAPAVNRCL